MSVADFLVAGDVAAALAECSDPGSFHFKRFSQTSGLAKKSPAEIVKIFAILDDDRSGFIEKKELKLFLRFFCPQARELSEDETDSFVTVGDENGDGRIDCAEPIAEMDENILSKRDKPKFSHDGYLYVFDKCSKTDPTLLSWRCREDTEYSDKSAAIVEMLINCR